MQSQRRVYFAAGCVRQGGGGGAENVWAGAGGFGCLGEPGKGACFFCCSGRRVFVTLFVAVWRPGRRRIFVFVVWVSGMLFFVYCGGRDGSLLTYWPAWLGFRGPNNRTYQTTKQQQKHGFPCLIATKRQVSTLSLSIFRMSLDRRQPSHARAVTPQSFHKLLPRTTARNLLAASVSCGVGVTGRRHQSLILSTQQKPVADRVPDSTSRPMSRLSKIVQDVPCKNLEAHFSAQSPCHCSEFPHSMQLRHRPQNVPAQC